MDLKTLSEYQLRRELKTANEAYEKYMSKIPGHAWQYEPYKSVNDYLHKLREEFVRRQRKKSFKE